MSTTDPVLSDLPRAGVAPVGRPARTNPYRVETGFVAFVLMLSVAGFWNLYFGGARTPGGLHHLHVATNFLWLALLLAQLVFLGTGRFGSHRAYGLLALLVAPLLVASTALLSVHSARRGLASGQGDFMIVQNVATTLQLAAFIALAFVLRRRRKLHGAFLMGTTLPFFGIALFFTLTGVVPGFRIEGPETFHRFQSAIIVAQGATLAVAVLLFLRDRRNGWPLLVAGALITANEGIRQLLAARDLIDPLTVAVASLDPAATFVGAFAALLASLVATGMLRGRAAPPRAAPAH